VSLKTAAQCQHRFGDGGDAALELRKHAGGEEREPSPVGGVVRARVRVARA
jgi:hypothetical protein